MSLNFNGVILRIVNGHLNEDVYVIPYETEYIVDPTLEEGQEYVLIEGVNGIWIDAYEVTFFGGGDYQRTLDYKYMRQNLVNRVVVVREIP